MIRVNLLVEEKDRSAAYAIHALILIGIVVILLLLGGWTSNRLISSLSEYENEVGLKESELIKLKDKTKKVENMEQNQKLLIEKLEIIAKLKTRKQGPVRILDDLTKAIPERAWLTSVSQKNDTIELSGVAVDGQTVSDFISRLRESKFIDDADVVKTQLIMKDEVKMQSFTFPAQLSELLTLKKQESPESGKKKPKKSRKNNNNE
jgi:type IV pilus assembly protein PilN